MWCFFLYMRPFISSEGKGGFFFHYLFICMTLDMTVCRVFLALKADFTCFSLVNISRDKRGRVECVFACECVNSWGSCSLCSVKLGLTDVSILSDLIVHRGKKLYWFVWTITKVHCQTDQRQGSLLKPGETRCLMTDVKHLTSLQWNHKIHIWHTQFIENKNKVNTVINIQILLVL